MCLFEVQISLIRKMAAMSLPSDIWSFTFQFAAFYNAKCRLLACKRRHFGL